MKIEGQNYSIIYEPNNNSVVCKGSFRLRGADEYDPIINMLGEVIDQNPEHILLDLRELEFLNSSGINMLSKFVINVRKQGETKLTVLGSEAYPWQNKSLKNFQRLMPGLVLEIESP